MTDLAITNTNDIIQAEILQDNSDCVGIIQDEEFGNDAALITAFLTQKTEKTKITYQPVIEEFVSRYGKLNDVTFTVLMDYREYLKENLKVSTANKKISAIKSLFSFAIDIGYLNQNPARLLKKLDQNKDDKSKQSKDIKERILTKEQIDKIIDNTKSQRDYLMIKTAYYVGLRIHELCNHHVDDLFVEGDYCKAKVIGKGGKIRFPFIPKTLYQEVLEFTNQGYIFTTTQGTKVSPRLADQTLKRILKRAGLSKDISYHWFRHSHASHALANGASLKSVQKQLGHSSIAVTSLYLHDNDDPTSVLDI